jgi:hypothetical protein
LSHGGAADEAFPVHCAFVLFLKSAQTTYTFPSSSTEFETDIVSVIA